MSREKRLQEFNLLHAASGKGETGRDGVYKLHLALGETCAAQSSTGSSEDLRCQENKGKHRWTALIKGNEGI